MQPLTPLSMGILLALAHGDLHGYGLLQELEDQTDGALTPGTGTLYAALQRMMDEGLIVESPDLPAPGEDQRRRYYRITQAGAPRGRAGERARVVAAAASPALPGAPRRRDARDLLVFASAGSDAGTACGARLVVEGVGGPGATGDQAALGGRVPAGSTARRREPVRRAPSRREPRRSRPPALVALRGRLRGTARDCVGRRRGLLRRDRSRLVPAAAGRGRSRAHRAPRDHRGRRRSVCAREYGRGLARLRSRPQELQALHRVTGGLDDPPTPGYFLPRAQAGEYLGDSRLFVRAEGDMASLLPVIRSLVQRADPSMPAALVQPVQAQLDPSLSSWRMGAMAFSALGGVAAVVAAIGLFSVLAFLVAERRREFAIRGALGGDAARIIGPVLQQGLAVVVLGALVGAALISAVEGRLQPLLFQVELLEPAVVASVVLGTLAVGALAAYAPARRAARVNPLDPLKEE